MKKLLLIFGVTALVSFILFGISVATLGVRDDNFSFYFGNRILGPAKTDIYYKNGAYSERTSFDPNHEYVFDFPDADIKDIKLGTISAKVNVRCEGTDKAVVKYTAGDKGTVGFSAVYDNNILTLTEEAAPVISLFNLWGSYKSPSLEVILPEKEYYYVSFNIVSGGCTVDGLVCSDFTASNVSGGSSYKVFADNISITSTSGAVGLENCTDRTASSISISNISGRTKVSHSAKNWNITSVSGEVTAEGLSGDVKAEMTSGSISLTFSEWSGDLDIDTVSGSVNVLLPENSGMELDYSRASGKVTVDLGSDKRVLKDEGRVTVGGTNVHKADIDTTSGNVTIRDK